MSEDLGDRRSRALINLHLGRLHFFGNRVQEAMGALSEGKAEVEDLGDEDIRIEAAEFIGMYYLVQGRFSEARSHFEVATLSYDAGEPTRLTNPSAPLWLVVCSVYLAQFHDAIGTADYYHRQALDRSEHGQAALLQALLGVILSYIHRSEEAESNLSSALEKSIQTKNVLAGTFAKAGIGYQFYREGRFQ